MTDRNKPAPLPRPWRRDGRTIWSGDWRTDGVQHPVCTYWLSSDPSGLEAPPIGTEANLDLIVAAVNAHDRLLAGIRALHDMVDLTDPNDPIGVALTRAGLERRP